MGKEPRIIFDGIFEDDEMSWQEFAVAHTHIKNCKECGKIEKELMDRIRKEYDDCIKKAKRLTTHPIDSK